MFSADILDLVRRTDDVPFRPQIPPEKCSPEWMELIEFSWHENPENRPTFTMILAAITEIEGLRFVCKILRILNKVINSNEFCNYCIYALIRSWIEIAIEFLIGSNAKHAP